MSEKIFPIKIIVETSEEANKRSSYIVWELLARGNMDMAGIVSADMPSRRRVSVKLGNGESIILPRIFWPR